MLFGLVLAASPAEAFDPVTTAVAVGAAESIGVPVAYALGCGMAYSPPIRLFGNENAVYGLDFGSMACHARDVYGLQLSLCGGAVEHRLWGLQIGILATGYASHELLFGDYHFFNTDFCHMNGFEFGTFAAKTAKANGVQASVCYAEAERVNGVQVGLVTVTKRLRGLQVGFVNTAETGCGLQVGLVNRTLSGLSPWLPGLNLVW